MPRKALHLIRAGGLPVVLAVAVVGATAARAADSDADSAAQSKSHAYTVKASYTLTRETVDPSTALRVAVERRLEAEFRVWARVSEDQVYTGTTGDYAEADGRAVATVRDERSSAPCTQTVEAKGRIGLKFVTNRAPLTSVFMPWSPGSATRLPQLPCGAAEIARWETGTRGKGDWARVETTLLWHESRTKFYGDVYTKLAGGRNAVLELAFASPRQQAGTTERAVLRLEFVRRTEGDPKPPTPSAKRVVIEGPVARVGRYNGAAWFIVSRGGEATGMSRAKSKCTGAFSGGRPPLYGSPALYAIYPLVADDRTIRLAQGMGGERLARLVVRHRGKRIALVSCSYEHEEYTTACGKTFRGSLKLVVDDTKAVTKRFSFPWIDPTYAKGRCS